MKHILFSLLFLACTFMLKAQDTVALKASAIKMSKAVASGDLNTLSLYTHPKIIAAMGGKQKMIAVVKASMDEMANNGMAFRASSIGQIGKLFNTGQHIYCVVPHTVELNYRDGYLSAESSILAVSDDKGKTWKFVSAGNIGYDKLKSIFPDLPKGLKILPQTQPIIHTNDN